MTRVAGLLIAVAALVVACAAGPPSAAALDTRNEHCRFCRMVVSEHAFASQIVAPGEEPQFFDDLGCFRSFLDGAPKIAAGSVTYVADHLTKAWVRADQAIFVEAVTTRAPMGSPILAFGTSASRDADPDAAVGKALTLDAVFGAHRVPGGQ